MLVMVSRCQGRVRLSSSQPPPDVNDAVSVKVDCDAGAQLVACREKILKSFSHRDEPRIARACGGTRLRHAALLVTVLRPAATLYATSMAVVAGLQHID
jgi:hypothetical protein